MANIELKVGQNISKDGLKKRAEFMLAQVENGEVNALDLFVVAKAYARLADAILKGSQSEAITEAKKYSDRDNQVNGIKFTVVEGGSPKFNFSADPYVAKLEEELKDRKEAIKRASIAKLRGKSDPVILDGEEIQAQDPVGYSGGYLKIEL